MTKCWFQSQVQSLSLSFLSSYITSALLFCCNLSSYSNLSASLSYKLFSLLIATSPLLSSYNLFSPLIATSSLLSSYNLSSPLITRTSCRNRGSCDVDGSSTRATLLIQRYVCTGQSAPALCRSEDWGNMLLRKAMVGWNYCVEVRELKLECWSESVEIIVLKLRVEVRVLKLECWSESVEVRVLKL